MEELLIGILTFDTIATGSVVAPTEYCRLMSTKCWLATFAASDRIPNI